MAIFEYEIGILNNEIQRSEHLSVLFVSIENSPLMVPSTEGMGISSVRGSSVGIVSDIIGILAGKWRYSKMKSGL